MVGLGDLPGGAVNSEGCVINLNDGTVVVGPGAAATGQMAYSWTSAGGFVALGDLAGGTTSSRAYAADATGAAIVGRSNSTNGVEAFRWSGGTMVALGD